MVEVLDDPTIASIESPGEPPEVTEYKSDIIKMIQDSLKVENNWRTRGRQIQEIYRGDLNSAGLNNKTSPRYNILFSNTAILLPSVFSKAPIPEIESKGLDNNQLADMISEALQKTARTLMDTTDVFENIKASVKEVLLPGRGVCRVRWSPVMEETAQVGPDGQPMNPTLEKLLDLISIEHVYWEDFTYEAVNNWENVSWVAFRHLYNESEFMEDFSGNAKIQELAENDQLSEIFTHTDKTAKYSDQNERSTGSTSNTTSQNGLQDQIMKAMVWEFWDKQTRQVTFICQDLDGLVLQTDPDPMGLANFFPVPKPLLAVTTTDQLIPVPEFVIYQDLAAEIDETSDRIAAITRRIKIRGAYNSTQEELGNILTAQDGEMIAINGAEYNFTIKDHVYVVSIEEHIRALQTLYQSREASKQAMYDVTGISDIVRGQSRASETLGAQQMKAQFATLRIQDRKTQVEFFCRDIIRIICEVAAENFSPESFYYYSGIQLPPEAFQILRNEGLRVSQIEVESDSTSSADTEADQQAMASLTQALGMVLQQVFPQVQAGIMPLPIAMEMVKMVTKPFKYSRNLHRIIDAQMAALAKQAGAPPQAQPGQPAQQPQQPTVRAVQ